MTARLSPASVDAVSPGGRSLVFIVPSICRLTSQPVSATSRGASDTVASSEHVEAAQEDPDHDQHDAQASDCGGRSHTTPATIKMMPITQTMGTAPPLKRRKPAVTPRA